MVGVVIFSGSQAPLAVRYPFPSKPRLALPPLVHRSLHTALDATPPSAQFQGGLLSIPQRGTLAKHALEPDHDVTVKVQVDSAPDVVGAIKEALETLARSKGLSSVDTALVGLPTGTTADQWNLVWKTVTGGDVGSVKQWGTIGLKEEQLEELSKTRTPVVNELNVTDCTTLPKECTDFAKEKGIQLWASGGAAGPEPIPSADLHNLLHEFRSKLSILAPSASTTHLAELIPLDKNGEGYDSSVTPGVKVRWVVSYTVVSRARNIVKDKGYIVAADFA